MKIRADFVTNSSSVSYIVSFNQIMADWGKLTQSSKDVFSEKNKRIYLLIAEDIEKTGEILEKNGNTLYIKQYDFSKKPDSKYDDSFGVPIDEVDFAVLSDDAVWAYIHGEYLVNGRLASELKGFGSVQVPRDKEALKQKKETFLERQAKAGEAK
ncbi:MAG: hypothetical protein LBT32_07840 [Peptococcaceae bacterium]|jgi:hypothetical protein|nr:hypothetical protein [Peptococcaceae bacterium]